MREEPLVPKDGDQLSDPMSDSSSSSTAAYSAVNHHAHAMGAPVTHQTTPEEDAALATKLSPWQASVNLGKCCVGAGCFILPMAFKNSGVWAGVISLVLLGALSTYTIRLLAASERYYYETSYRRQEDEEQFAMPGTVEHDAQKSRSPYPSYFSMGWNLLGPAAGIVIWTGIVLTIVGVCGVYLDFIGSVMVDITDTYMTQVQYMLIASVPLLGISLLRSLKFLAFTSLLGDIAVTAGLFSVIIYGAVKETIHSPFDDLPAFNADTFPKFFGSAVFLFAIHAVILPISQSMREPKKFQGVALVSFTVIIILNTLFGAFGYMLYGDNVEGLAINNVKGPFGVGVKILLCLDLFFTVPIVMCAPRELLEQAILPRVATNWRYFTENCIRLGTVCLFTGLSLLIPDINDLASLVGALVSPIMGFILPPIFHLVLHSREIGILSRVFHILIVLFGIFSCIFSTYKQIESMVNK